MTIAQCIQCMVVRWWINSQCLQYKNCHKTAPVVLDGCLSEIKTKRNKKTFTSHLTEHARAERFE